MSRFQALIHITIEHGYYAAQPCRAVRLEAGDAGVVLARNLDLALKMSRGEAVVYGDVDSGALRSAVGDAVLQPAIWLKLVPVETGFINSTVLPARPVPAPNRENDATEPTVPVLTFDPAGSTDPGEPAELTPAYAGLTATQLTAMLSARDARKPPFALIRLAIDSLEPRRYVVRFAARKTRWRYFLLGELAQVSARIVDKNDRTQFEQGHATLANNRDAVTFTSRQAIALRELSSEHFQLVTNGPGVNRVLIKRLPVAAAGKFNRERDRHDGELPCVSEIYVNH